MAIFDKKGGCVAIYLQPEAHTPHYTYVFLPYIAFLDLWWRPVLGQRYIFDQEMVSTRNPRI
jgi:hypothetical protein